jgi:hypothetical protein
MSAHVGRSAPRTAQIHLRLENAAPSIHRDGAVCGSAVGGSVYNSSFLSVTAKQTKLGFFVFNKPGSFS